MRRTLYLSLICFLSVGLAKPVFAQEESTDDEEYTQEEEAPDEGEAALDTADSAPQIPDSDRGIHFSDAPAEQPLVVVPTASPKSPGVSSEPTLVEKPVVVPTVISTPAAYPTVNDNPIPSASGFSLTPPEPSPSVVPTQEQPETKRFFEQLIERVRATKQGPAEILIMRAMMEHLAFRNNPSTAVRSRLAASLEQLIGPLCMPLVFRELSYFGNPQDPDCREVIKETLEVDPENPVAICANVGFGPDRCTHGYEDQLVIVADLSLSSQDNNPIAKAFEESEQTKIRPRIEELELLLSKREAELKEIDSQLKSKNPPIIDAQGIRDRIYDLHAHLVTLKCRSTKISLHERTPDEVKAWELKHANPAQIRKGILPEQDMKKLGFLSTPMAPAKSAPAFQRIRALTQDCRNAIDAARRFQSDFPTALCAELGEYSPACISALKKAKETRSRTQPSTAIGKSPRPKAAPVKKDPGTLATF